MNYYIYVFNFYFKCEIIISYDVACNSKVITHIKRPVSNNKIFLTISIGALYCLIYNILTERNSGTTCHFLYDPMRGGYVCSDFNKNYIYLARRVILYCKNTHKENNKKQRISILILCVESNSVFFAFTAKQLHRFQ